MAKSTAQRQREFREREKAKDGCIEKAKKHIKKAKEVPVKPICKNKQIKRRAQTKERVAKHRKEKKRKTEEQSSNHQVVAYPKKGTASRKRREATIRQIKTENKELSKTIETLLTRCAKQRKQIQRLRETINNLQNSNLNLSPNSFNSVEVRNNGLSPRKLPKDIRRKLLFAEVISREISTNAKKIEKSVLNKIITGKIMKKYRLIRYASTKTGVSRRKTRSKIPEDQSQDIKQFYLRDDVSTALPGKNDATKVGEVRVQTRTLTDYLHQLHTKFCSENPAKSVSLTKFQRLRPENCRLVNFTNRSTCLCKVHQNIALKLKMLKENKIVETENPNSFIKSSGDDKVSDMLEKLKNGSVKFEEWRRVEVEVKCKNGTVTKAKRIKVVQAALERDTFIDLFLKDISEFRNHCARITNHFTAVQDIKRKLLPSEVMIHMDFSEDYRCVTKDEIQAAYWDCTRVTLHPVVAYFREECH